MTNQHGCTNNCDNQELAEKIPAYGSPSRRFSQVFQLFNLQIPHVAAVVDHFEEERKHRRDLSVSQTPSRLHESHSSAVPVSTASTITKHDVPRPLIMQRAKKESSHFLNVVRKLKRSKITEVWRKQWPKPCNAPVINLERKDDPRRLHYTVNVNVVSTVMWKVMNDAIKKAARYYLALLVPRIMEQFDNIGRRGYATGSTVRQSFPKKVGIYGHYVPRGYDFIS